MAYNPNNPNGSATSANSSPVVIASDQAAVPISDNGGSVTVDGTVAVSNFPATQPVSGAVTVSGTVTANAGTGTQNVSVQNASIPVTDNGGSLTVDGTVAVSNFPATQAVSGPLTDTQLRTTAVPISGTVSTGLSQPLTDTQLRATAVPVSGPLTDAQIRATALPISGTVTANAGTGTQNVSVQNASIPVTGTFFQATQPISGTVAATQATAANFNATVVGTGTFAVQADTELPAATALGDSTANPTAPHVGSCIEAYNGTTWDRVRTIDALTGTGANNGTLGVIAVGTGPGFSHRYNPANLGTAISSVSAIEVEGGNTMSFGIGTTTTGTFIFEGTADATNWLAVEVFDAGLDMWVSGQNITPTLGKVYHLSIGGYRQIRLRTTATLGATVAHTCNVSASQQLLAGIDTGAAPHNFGYLLVHKDGEYTTAQTTTALWTPTTGKKFTVTDITISTGNTTSGIVTVFDSAAATAYSAGTTPAIFRGEFAPSATVKPGAVKSFNVPYVSTTVNNRLHVTTSAAMTIYIQLNGYEI